ncbi:MAG: hypothetical protein AAFX52_01060 [Pseudomonadota bacterium]
MKYVVAVGEYVASNPVLITAIVALILAVFGYWNNQRRHRASETLQLMMEVLRNNSFSTMSRITDDHFIRGETVDHDALDDEMFQGMTSVLANLEYLAFAYNVGTVHRKSIDRMILLRILKSYWVMRPFIMEKRQADASYYTEIETIALKGHQSAQYRKRFEAAAKARTERR